MDDKQIIQQALEIVKFGLEYNVDYILLLEQLEKILNGKKVKATPKDLLDF